MAPKKSDFLCFMQKKRREIPAWASKSLPELVELCGPLWEEEKHKQQARDRNAEPTCDRAIQLEIKLKQKEEENMLMQADIRAVVRDVRLAQRLFCVMQTNVFYQTDEGVIIPAELYLGVFSLGEGLLQEYHTFIDPGPIPMGYHFKCQELAARTHRIPLDLVYFNPNYHEILYKVMSLLDAVSKDCDDGEPLVFCMPAYIHQNMKVLEWLCAKCKERAPPLRMYDISELLWRLRRGVDILVEEGDYLVTKTIAEQLLNQEKFSFRDGVRCDFHDAQDLPFCSQAIGRNWMYVLLDSCCPVLGITMLNGKHRPALKADTSQEEQAARSRPDVEREKEEDLRSISALSFRSRTDSEMTERSETSSLVDLPLGQRGIDSLSSLLDDSIYSSTDSQPRCGGYRSSGMERASLIAYFRQHANIRPESYTTESDCDTQSVSSITSAMTCRSSVSSLSGPEPDISRSEILARILERRRKNQLS